MALPFHAPRVPSRRTIQFLRRTRIGALLVLAALLALCLVFAWLTRDAMSTFQTNRAQGKVLGVGAKVVDQTPWQTAQALAPLAISAEELAYAREAERLADHEVDQAFAAALRQATLDAEHPTLTGEAKQLEQKITELQQLVAQDQSVVRQLSSSGASTGHGANGASSNDDQSDLDIAKAQLQLDSDQLSDAEQDLDRASGDQRSQIQSELTAREQAMKKYDSQQQAAGQTAVLSASRYGTLAGRVKAWNNQRNRSHLLAQAIEQTQADIQNLISQHNALQAKADTAAAAPRDSSLSRNAQLSTIRDRSAQRQLLSIYDDRIQTEQQLVTIYSKWLAQVALQHRILLHMLMQSCAWVLVILICMLLGDRLVRRLMERLAMDRRQRQTLRTVVELSVQILGGLCILLVVFGAPRETPTILGLTTAALTIALQDFVLAFFGWFVLLGKKGMRVGDTVEINGVGGEVIEIGLLSTTLLETGKLSDQGYPTGRRISFMNGFAIRGQYFNFSTSGQWMWDEFNVSLPPSGDTNHAVASILKVVEEETAQDTRIAEQEWKRSLPAEEWDHFHAVPSANLRPSGGNIDLEVRFVTRASERFQTRNRLYQRVIELLHQMGSSQ